jgi:hypothetical protein
MKLRTSFIHRHRTPVDDLSIQCSHSGSGFGRLRHLDKGDTAGLARISVRNDRDSFDGSMYCKNFPQLLLSYRDAKVPDKNVGHKFIPAADILQRSQEREVEFRKKATLRRSPFCNASRA